MRAAPASAPGPRIRRPSRPRTGPAPPPARPSGSRGTGVPRPRGSRGGARPGCGRSGRPPGARRRRDDHDAGTARGDDAEDPEVEAVDHAVLRGHRQRDRVGHGHHLGAGKAKGPHAAGGVEHLDALAACGPWGVDLEPPRQLESTQDPRPAGSSPDERVPPGQHREVRVAHTRGELARLDSHSGRHGRRERQIDRNPYGRAWRARGRRRGSRLAPAIRRRGRNRGPQVDHGTLTERSPAGAAGQGSRGPACGRLGRYRLTGCGRRCSAGP
jgi:hypothetical protein